MRRLIKALLIGGAAVMSATSANAGVSINFSNGTGGLTVGETLFASFDSGPSSYGGVTGSLYSILTGSGSAGADPAVGTMGDPYLSVLGGGFASFTFAGLTQLGFDYGSADAYNTFQLFFSDGTNQTLTGTDIISAAADGDQSAPRTNGRVTFTAAANQLITGLRLSSTTNSLETDNYGIISAVPEPATWGLMIFGIAGIGGAMRRRRSLAKVQYAY